MQSACSLLLGHKRDLLHRVGMVYGFHLCVHCTAGDRSGPSGWIDSNQIIVIN